MDIKRDYTLTNLRCTSTALHIRKLIAKKRLEDVLKIAEVYYSTGKKQKQICFFVKCFSRLAGYSEAASLDLTEIINSRFSTPFHPWQLTLAIKDVEECIKAKGELVYNYSNKTLVSELGINQIEKKLELKIIMSDGERRRRKSIRNARDYARRRGGLSKKEKIKARLASLAHQLIKGNVDMKAYCQEHGIKKSIYYDDLKKAKTMAIKLLLLINGFPCHSKKLSLTSCGKQTLTSRLFFAVKKAFKRYGYLPLLQVKLLKILARPPTFFYKSFSEKFSL